MLSIVKKCHCDNFAADSNIMYSDILADDLLLRKKTTNNINVIKNYINRTSDNILTAVFCTPAAVKNCFSSVFFFMVLMFVIASSETASGSVTNRQMPIYMNQFAVHIPKGKEVADEVAAKHGFRNIGQV